MNHFVFMKRCLELVRVVANLKANTALLEGEVPIACVFVLDGKIIGEGFNKTNQKHDVVRVLSDSGNTAC